MYDNVYIQQYLELLYQYHYFPQCDIPTIQQIISNPSLTLRNSGCTDFKSHFFTESPAELVINYLTNQYEYGDSIQTLHIDDIHSTKCNYSIPLIHIVNRTVKTLRKYEKQYNIKYVIIDKLLGPGIIDDVLYFNTVKTEINKILKPIKNTHNPATIRDKATQFVHKFSHILHDKGYTPNQSLIDVLDDIHQTKNGYFKWNPLYKAHKFDEFNNHIPKIRPIISSKSSPLQPILKIIADACIIIIHVLQNMYNMINVIQDSFHVIDLIDIYIKNKFNPTDNIITFDFASFYTELPIKFINEELTFLQKLFHDKYKQNLNYDFYIDEQLILPAIGK